MWKTNIMSAFQSAKESSSYEEKSDEKWPHIFEDLVQKQE